MKILVLFIDMVRTDMLSSYNSNRSDTSIDVFMKNLRGVLYDNCYTPGPDTSRSNACMQTGLYPSFNGVDSRVKRAKDYVKEEVSTIFDKAVERNFNVNCILTPHLYKWGLMRYKESENIHIFHDLSAIQKVSCVLGNVLTFVFNQDLHMAIDDYGAGSKGHKEGYRLLSNCFKTYLSQRITDLYDHIFIYSDHGLKVEKEFYMNYSQLDLLNDGRTKILMFHHKKGDKEMYSNRRLSCIIDLYSTIDKLLGDNDFRQGIPLDTPSPKGRIIHVEDHIDFKLEPNKVISLWRIISDNFDIRTNIKDTIIDRGSKNDLNQAMEYLYKYSPTVVEYEKYIKYLKLYSKMKRDHYLIGEDRPSEWKKKYRIRIPWLIKKIFYIPYYRYQATKHNG